MVSKLEFLRQQIKEQEELKKSRTKVEEDKEEIRLLEAKLRKLKRENRHPKLSAAYRSISKGARNAEKVVSKYANRYNKPRKKKKTKKKRARTIFDNEDFGSDLDFGLGL